MRLLDIAGRLPIAEPVRRQLPIAEQQVAVARLEGVITPAGSDRPGGGGSRWSRSSRR